MSHLVLLGDSIFDNARYVPGGPSVLDHLQKLLPPPSKATLLAIDGSVTADVHDQIRKLPKDATHLALSVGGNDALGYSIALLGDGAASKGNREMMMQVANIQDTFRIDYRRVLEKLQPLGKPVLLCTIYENIPGLGRAERAGLTFFNEVILYEAIRNRLPVLDLRLVCQEASDYSELSPIEPSESGGAKIARGIKHRVTDEKLRDRGSLVFFV